MAACVKATPIACSRALYPCLPARRRLPAVIKAKSEAADQVAMAGLLASVALLATAPPAFALDALALYNEGTAASSKTSQRFKGPSVPTPSVSKTSPAPSVKAAPLPTPSRTLSTEPRKLMVTTPATAPAPQPAPQAAAPTASPAAAAAGSGSAGVPGVLAAAIGAVAVGFFATRGGGNKSDKIPAPARTPAKAALRAASPPPAKYAAPTKPRGGTRSVSPVPRAAGTKVVATGKVGGTRSVTPASPRAAGTKVTSPTVTTKVPLKSGTAKVTAAKPVARVGTARVDGTKSAPASDNGNPLGLVAVFGLALAAVGAILGSNSDPASSPSNESTKEDPQQLVAQRVEPAAKPEVAKIVAVAPTIKEVPTASPAVPTEPLEVPKAPPAVAEEPAPIPEPARLPDPVPSPEPAPMPELAPTPVVAEAEKPVPEPAPLQSLLVEKPAARPITPAPVVKEPAESAAPAAPAAAGSPTTTVAEERLNNLRAYALPVGGVLAAIVGLFALTANKEPDAPPPPPPTAAPPSVASSDATSPAVAPNSSTDSAAPAAEPDSSSKPAAPTNPPPIEAAAKKD